MNRKDRRATASRQHAAATAITKNSDVSADSRFALSGAIQDAVHQAIQQLALGPEHIPVIVHALGMTAAGLACRAGVEPDEFAAKMRLYLSQVQQAVEQAQAEPQP